MLQYLRDHPGESGIIYCATRKNVDKLQELLVEAGRRQIPRRADRRGPPHQQERFYLRQDAGHRGHKRLWHG